MRIHIIACRVFSRELNRLAAVSENQIDITYIGRGLHNTPDALHKRLQGAIDSVYDQLESGESEFRPDAIVLLYGLCSNVILGLTCRDIPIIVPKTDDCIALFLGSQEKYLEAFEKTSGAYWLNSGWLEQSGKFFSDEDLRRRKWQEYAEKFGEDNADYLMEIETGWMKHYTALGYIHSETYDPPEYLERARGEADKQGWELREVAGNTRMLEMIANGTWNEAEFLVLKAGEKIAADYTGAKIKAVPAVNG